MKKILVALGLAIAVLCLHPPAAAVESVPSQLTYEQTIAGCTQQIGKWNRAADWEEALTICVIVFGGIISVFHLAKWPGAKTVAVVLGVVTSTLTAINAKGFTADYGTLRKAAARGEAIVNELDTIVAIINESHPTGQQLDADNAQFAKKISEFNSIGLSLAGAPVGQVPGEALPILRLPAVLARSAGGGAPSWVNQRPSSAGSLYYVGKARDKTLAAAQSASLKDALAQAVREISQQIPDSSADKIQALVSGSYVVQDTSLQCDQRSGTCTYYTLVRVSKVILSLGRPVPRAYQQSGWTPADLTAQGPTVIALDTKGGVSSIQSDSHGTHVNLLFRLQPALSGAAVTATANYVYATANSALGCTVVRYSLATHRTDQRLIAVHKQCVGVAGDGSTLYVVLPADRAILHLRNWTGDADAWSISASGALLTLAYDRFGRRLIASDTDGHAYSVSTANGAAQLLTGGLGYVQSLTVSSQYIMAASGQKILFIGRSNNKGMNPPSGAGPLPGGKLVGVAVDGAGGMWIADYDKKLVEGPFLLD